MKKDEARKKDDEKHVKIAQQLKEKAENERKRRAREQEEKWKRDEKAKTKVSSEPMRAKEEDRDDGEYDEERLEVEVDYSPADEGPRVEEFPKEGKTRRKEQKPRIREEDVPKTLQELQQLMLEPNKCI
jgi:hypothetical protein